jgi:hypothetical protein
MSSFVKVPGEVNGRVDWSIEENSTVESLGELLSIRREFSLGPTDEQKGFIVAHSDTGSYVP